MKFILILPLGMTLLTMTGCNTVKGFGNDISGSASYVQDKMSGGDSAVKSSDSQYVKNPPDFPKANYSYIKATCALGIGVKAPA